LSLKDAVMPLPLDDPDVMYGQPHNALIACRLAPLLHFYTQNSIPMRTNHPTTTAIDTFLASPPLNTTFLPPSDFFLFSSSFPNLYPFDPATPSSKSHSLYPVFVAPSSLTPSPQSAHLIIVRLGASLHFGPRWIVGERSKYMLNPLQICGGGGCVVAGAEIVVFAS
jgi:hypothetical protein